MQYFRDALIHQLPSQQRMTLRHAMSEDGGAMQPSSFPPTSQHALTSTVTSDDSSVGARPPRAARPVQHQQPVSVSNPVHVSCC